MSNGQKGLQEEEHNHYFHYSVYIRSVKMNIKRDNICRLCLDVAKNEFGKIDEVMKQICHILLLKLNLDITSDPIICRDCLEICKRCLDFKLISLGTEQSILLFSTDRNKDVEHDIRVIYKERESIEAVVESLDICRFCMTELQRNTFASLSFLRNKMIMFEMLPKYMPEMDFNIIENPMICTTCSGNLELYFKILVKCFNIERQIKTFCKEDRTDSMGRVDLGNIQGSLFDILKHSEKCLEINEIKEEWNVFEDTWPVYAQINQSIKEELDIKEEIHSQDNSFKNSQGMRLHKPGNMFHLKEFGKETISDAFKVKPEIVLKSPTKIHIGASKGKKKNNVNIHKCSICSYETTRKRSFTQHLVIHKDISEIKMYKCSLCAYETTRKGSLSRHIMLIHKDVSELKMYNCSLCAYESKERGTLKRHMLIHKNVSEIEMHKCSLCAYETKRKHNLRNHLLIHKDASEIKMNKCSLCAYETKHKNSLRRHNMLVHRVVSEEKLRKCTLCPYEFEKNHLLEDKDAHKCSLCPYKTKRKFDLKRHMLTHEDISKIETHKCSLCTYESKYKDNVYKHFKAVHKDVSETKTHK